MFPLLGGHWQVLTNFQVWCGSLDGIEWPTILYRRLGFHVPHIDVGGTAAKEKQDDRLGWLFAPASQIGRRGHQRGAKLQTTQTGG